MTIGTRSIQIKIPQPIHLAQGTSRCLDAVRAVAAIIVMMSHLRAMYFVDLRHVESLNANVFVRAIYGITGLGHQSVMVFFVLSGFFISSSILRKFARGSWCWRDYSIDRGVRLYLVLIPGLVLGMTWDLIGIKFFNTTGIYSAPLSPFGSNIPVKSLTALSFLGNLLFFQTRFAPIFGSNGPLWSLFNEFWYYILFPALFLMILAIRERAIRTAVRYFLVVAFTSWVLGSGLIGFVVWLTGFGVALSAHRFRFEYSNGWHAAIHVLCTAALFSFCLLSARLGRSFLGSDLAVGLSFALVMHGILQLQFDVRPRRLHFTHTLAGSSYSLYVLHFPLLLLIRAMWMPHQRWQPTALHLGYGLAIAGCSLLYASSVARLTEWNTSAVRKWVRNSIDSRYKRDRARAVTALPTVVPAMQAD